MKAAVKAVVMVASMAVTLADVTDYQLVELLESRKVDQWDRMQDKLMGSTMADMLVI